MKQLRLYYHTVRYLMPIQIYGRLWFKLKKPSVRTFKHIPAMEFPTVKIPFLAKPENYLYTICKQYAGDWQSQYLEKLFLYHLHYFDYPEYKWLIPVWIKQNSPGTYPSWDSYPLSMRIVNWIKWILAGHQESVSTLLSLMAQADYLSRRLEFHLLGNHLLANAKALLFAGVFFGAAGDNWREKALVILDNQLDKQILADGGHIERSTQYHCLVLEDLLDCVNLLKIYGKVIPVKWSNCIYKMLQWLEVMSHPDGDIALFNDATLKTTPSPAKLIEYANLLGYTFTSPKGSHFLKTSGYARLQRNKAHVLIDVAPLGPDYLLGHAHADTFTFELSLEKQRIIVNSGISTYANNSERLLQRGTLAHNTLMIDHTNSSEIWSSFRVAKRAKVSHINFSFGQDTDKISAEHDGYHSKMKIIHERSWRLTKYELRIEDKLRGKGVHYVTIPFHLHPDLTPELLDANQVVIRKENRLLAKVYLDSQLVWSLKPGNFYPDFGIAIANWRIIGENRIKLPLQVSHLFVWECSENAR